MSNTLNRRKFFSKTALSTAGLMLAAGIPGIGSETEAVGAEQAAAAAGKTTAGNLMKEVMKYRKIDSHIHALLAPSVTPELLIDYADRLGIETMIISRPITKEVATQEDVKASNDLMVKIMNKTPGRSSCFKSKICSLFN